MADELELADLCEDEADEEPLFADDLGDEYDDPPPLPPRFSEGGSGGGGSAAVGSGGTSLLPPEFGGGAGAIGGGATQDASAEQELPQKKRRTLLTLKIDRVFSEQGLPYIEKEFPKLKFKGKGHEAADLKHLLKQYEHWANMLFPKMTCKDVTDRIEALGSKKEFKVRMANMRRRFARGGGDTPPFSDSEDDTQMAISTSDAAAANDRGIPSPHSSSDPEATTTPGMSNSDGQLLSRLDGEENSSVSDTPARLDKLESTTGNLASKADFEKEAELWDIVSEYCKEQTSINTPGHNPQEQTTKPSTLDPIRDEYEEEDDMLQDGGGEAEGGRTSVKELGSPPQEWTACTNLGRTDGDCGELSEECDML